MKQIVLQEILDKHGNSNEDTVSSAASSLPQKPDDLQDSQDPYDLQTKTARAWLLEKYKSQKENPIRTNGPCQK